MAVGRLEFAKIGQLLLLQLFIAELRDAHFKDRLAFTDDARSALVTGHGEEGRRLSDLQDGRGGHVIKVDTDLLQQSVLVTL